MEVPLPPEDIPVFQKLANLKNHADLWDPADISYAEFCDLYCEVAIKLFDEADKGVSSDYSN